MIYETVCYNSKDRSIEDIFFGYALFKNNLEKNASVETNFPVRNKSNLLQDSQRRFQGCGGTKIVK